MKKCIAFAAAGMVLGLSAQTTFPDDGIKEKDATYLLISGAKVHHPDGTVRMDDILIYKGRIVHCGMAGSFSLPADCRRDDYTGFHIYPSFIELDSDYGLPALAPSAKGERRRAGPVYERTENKALYWNEAIHPQYESAAHFTPDAKAAANLRKLGVGYALTHKQDGIARGTSALVMTGEERANEEMLLTEAGAHYSFSKGNSPQNYPSSVMGSVALLRQAYYDAAWYAAARPDEINYSLEAMNRQSALRRFLHADDKFDILRAARIGKEFNTTFIAVDDGTMYQILPEIQGNIAAAVIPLKLPAPFDVSDPDLSRFISQSDMMHWERAPFNAYYLREKGMVYALSLSGLKNWKEVCTNLDKLKRTGLSRGEILSALTTTPALLSGVDALAGRLAPGYMANFFATNGDIFDRPDNEIVTHWIRGKAHVLKSRENPELAAEYDLNIDGKYFALTVKGKNPKYEGQVTYISGKDTLKSKATVAQQLREVTLHFENPEGTGVYRLGAASISDNRIWDGKGLDPSGKMVSWSAIRKKGKAPKAGKTSKSDSLTIDSILTPPLLRYPMVAFGFDTLPVHQTLLIENATIWTNEAEGILRKASMLIHNGKLIAVGKDRDIDRHLSTLTTPGQRGETAQIVKYDARGKHITPGIIDEHSHIAISRGVNEGTQASSAEVRIGDALYPDDINIYRQLSGGVTAAQLLHGSANPIGGQSAIVKLRWGQGYDAMKFSEAPGFIKFALGENVKQANWGDLYSGRYPQTRMGVEQFFYEYFYRAREYGASKNASTRSAPQGRGRKAPASTPFRTDIEMEALLEILEGKRHISCHSYVQSEINMLMHVADSLGFKVNTFTHVLEGYKLADKLRKHGAGASTFSDWWAYKYEVRDAIPHNASLLVANGVNTAINSDDAEMGRRLNQEAAKGIKYGGMSEEDALKMVTLNPAIMLRIDTYVGSLKPGKDADFVIWNGHPLSVYSRAEKTFVDGKLYFDRERSGHLEQRDREERGRIAEKMLREKEKGAETRKPQRAMERYYHCDSED